MYEPQHRAEGLVISGTLRVEPPLEPDDIDLLTAIGDASLRAAIDDKRSALVDRLAPGHPDGANPWVACPEGCCLDLHRDGWVDPADLEPWLGYLVQAMFVDHTVTGAVMLWDCADRTFTALVVDGTKVRREAVLRPRAKRAKGRSGGGANNLRAV